MVCGTSPVSYKQTSMAITKQKKAEVIANVRDAATDAASVVFVHFKGLSMGDTSAMRKTLRESGIGYMVAKKTLIRTAFNELGQTGTFPELPGEIALAWSKEDPTLAARSVYEQSKKHKDALSIVGGIFEGSYQDAVQMNAIATIPPVPVLRGMFVNVINSPIQGLAVALGQIAEKRA
jgi:large subunit ribosomal protein L10